MANETEFGEFFVGRDVAIAFVLLLVLPALTYFAMTVPSVLFEGADGVGSWLVTLVVLYLEAVIITALYRTVVR